MQEHIRSTLSLPWVGVRSGLCKSLSVSIHCEEDPWEKYYARFEEPVCEIVPVGVVLTMVGTGSEMNTGAVITYPEKKLKSVMCLRMKGLCRNFPF